MRKLLCIFLAVMLLASTCCALTPEEAAQDLAKYGIMQGFPDGSFRLEETVTRAQCVKMIMTALKKTDFPGAGTIFSDVPKEHWAVGHIEGSIGEGVIIGFPDGTFRPEESVTKYQAIKMVVCMLKHDALDIKPFSYPDDYTDAAIDVKLVTEEEVGTQDAPASRGFVARLISKALDLPVAELYGLVHGTGSDYVLMNGLYGRPLKTLRKALDQ
ncbi:MAG: S-layer homology domain-containing protein [Oscillospiraceae bacterium]|nr:S-layer homology domain-containing protein [Oscillospiraceae bacterium]